jgi:hypothetical protein
MSHTTNLDFVPEGTGTCILTSCKVCVQEYFSRSRPFHLFGTAHYKQEAARKK